MSKKTRDTAVEKAVEVDTPTTPTSALTWSDWFDHWPELFARRWPESFRNMPFGPFGGEMFRIEHLTEDDDTMVIRAELPGLDPDQDVKIEIDEGRMTISGERREHHEVEEEHGYRSEFQYGSFCRSMRLPLGARVEDVTATYRDGILEVRVPVDAEAPTVTEIPITTT
jgi:HSP20 family protein